MESPRERIATELGGENAQTALEGLVALAFRTDLPSLADIVETLSEDKYYPWWVAIVAGLDETSSQDRDMGQIANSTLQAALAIGTDRLIFSENADERRRWKRSFLVQHPELARDAYLALARSHLARQKTHIDGLHPLLNDTHLASFRKDVSLLLLREFSNCAPSALEDLLEAALATSDAHTELLALSEHVLTQDGVGAEQRLLWLAAAYLLDPTSHEPQISACGSDMVWKLRDLSGTDHRRHNKAGYPLSVRQLLFLATFTAGNFVNTDHPKDGWSGSQNPWDGAEYVRSLVTQISAVPTAEATDALNALAQMAALESYSDYVKHALANQRARRRDAEYRQPDWPQTVRTLKNGGPASAADLHALVLAHLEDAKTRISASNTDIWKQFWNEDAYGRQTEPKVEESCRDVLIEILRPGLFPLSVALEPEGHMAADKRADMVAISPGMKGVAELKRDTHADVWTALETQLDRLYTRDPDASGYGIYIVFWYGKKRKGRVPAGPGGRIPGSVADMQRLLEEAVPDDKKARIAVIVLDVSGHAPVAR